MTRTSLVGGLFVAVFALARSGPAQPPKAKEPPPAPLLKLAPQAPGKAPRALAYRLLPDLLDLRPGNAAPVWLRASQAARNVRHKIADKEYAWSSTSDVALKDLPRNQVRAFLAPYKIALRLADQAARRSRCDWETDPPTIQSLHDGTWPMLDEIQGLRQLAFLLSVRCRLELSEADYERAAYTMQTGFALCRHIGGSDSFIQELVAIAVGTIMLGRVEEWAQISGSPNLYWALSDLPRPLVSVRRSVQVELDTIYRSFPQLRELKKKRRSKQEVQALADGLLKAWQGVLGVPGEGGSPWGGRLGIAALVAKTYPDAKRYLLAQGTPAKEVEAMPATQVVAVYFLDRYDRVRDDVLKWMSVPPWQGLAPLAKFEKLAQAQAKADGNPISALLLPAISRVYTAQVRFERHVAGLRGAEALRTYAAGHGGKVPAKWADITEVPLPIDPVTGKGLDAFYSVRDGKALLVVPPPPGMPPSVGRRYEYAGKSE
jgi:hypothetical protein